MISLRTRTEVGTYEIDFKQNDKKEIELFFTQSSKGKIRSALYKQLEKYTYEYTKEEFDRIKEIEHKYQRKLEQIVQRFHSDIKYLLDEIVEDI